MSSKGFFIMLGLSGFSPCPKFELLSYWVPMVMPGGVVELIIGGLSGEVSAYSNDDTSFLFGPRNLVVILWSNVFTLGSLLVQTLTINELIECDCFVLREWQKACCSVCFRSLVCITSFCTGVLAVILLYEVLSAFFSINFNELIKFITKFLSSFENYIAAEVGCQQK